jgi:hypothetical protein
MLTSLAGLWVGFGVAAGLLLCLIVYRAVVGITEDFLIIKMLDMLFRQRATETIRGSDVRSHDVPARARAARCGPRSAPPIWRTGGREGDTMTHSHVTRTRLAIVLSAAAIVLSWTSSVAPVAAATLLDTVVSSCGLLDPDPSTRCGDVHIDTGGFPIPGVAQKVASVRDNFTLGPSDPYTFLGVGTATAGFGHVGTFVEMEQLQALNASAGVVNAGFVDATTQSHDTLTFSRGATVRLGFTLDGPVVGVCDFGGASGFGCDHAFGSARAVFSAGIIGGTGAGVQFELTQNADTRTTRTVGTFDPQTRLLLSDPEVITGPMELAMASESLAQTLGPFAPAGRFNTQAVANFGDTATLTEILVFDADGNLLPDVTITSESGTVYPLTASAAPVPEPSSLVLVAAGLAGIFGWRRRHPSVASTD